MKKDRTIKKTVLYIVLIFGAITMIIPFIWMISSSLKLNKDIFNFPIEWIPKNPVWSNFKEAWEQANFTRLYLNTFFVAISVTLLQLLTCSMSAYSFSKLKYRMRDKIFLGYLCTLMVPFQVIMIPQFIIIKNLGISDTLWALILTGAFSPFGVFLLRQFFISIPDEIIEAARIDGAGEFTIYSRIMLPLCKPALASLGIFTFVFCWNDFLGPLIYINDPLKRTIQLGIRSFQTSNGTDFALVMAAAVCATLPIIIIYLFAQKYFIEGIAMTGGK
ncbi:carbohydrate ABC transporter permease [Clostridium cavendishii]|nr:carbohydrate ABC transporter permease [Clostridium cavendishii]